MTCRAWSFPSARMTGRAVMIAGALAAGCTQPTLKPESKSAGDEPERAPPIALRGPPSAELESRLFGIYGQLDGLDDVTVAVQDGVVQLGGTTENLVDERRAVSIGERLEGVVAVENRIEQTKDHQPALAPVARTIRRVADAVQDLLPELLAALLVLTPFVVLSLIIRRWRWPLHRLGLSRLKGSLVRAGLGSLVLLIGIVLALDTLDIMGLVGAIIGTLGLVGLVLGLAFKDWVANYFPGLMLGLHPPFEATDLVRIGEHEGRVVRITPRATVLMTTDGEEIRIPNALLFKRTLINFSHHRERRLRFPMPVAPNADLRAAHALGSRTLLDVRGVLSHPPPFMRTQVLEHDQVVVEFFAWVDQSAANFRDVESRAKRAVFEALIRGGVPLPQDEILLRRAPKGPAKGIAPLQPPAETDAEAINQAFLDDKLGRARSARRERDLLEESRHPRRANGAAPPGEPAAQPTAPGT